MNFEQTLRVLKFGCNFILLSRKSDVDPIKLVLELPAKPPLRKWNDTSAESLAGKLDISRT